MADIEIRKSSGKRRAGVKRNKRSSYRVDLTPMVDLGFLLITFFIFSITTSQPKSMSLVVPRDSKVSSKVPNSGALILLPGKNDRIWCYFGLDPSEMSYITYQDVRKIILEKKRTTVPKDFFIIIKSGNAAIYKNIVDILDEMNINDIPRYALAAPTLEEISLMNKSEMPGDKK